MKKIVEYWFIKGYGLMIDQPVELLIVKVGFFSVAGALYSLLQCAMLVGQSDAIEESARMQLKPLGLQRC